MTLPNGFKPLLASPIDLAHARYPMLVSPKLDGVRCIVAHDQVLTRNLKQVPNDHVRRSLAGSSSLVLDGELVTVTDGRVDDFTTTQSKVMRRSGEPAFVLYVFDCVTEDPFSVRLGRSIEACRGQHLTPLTHRQVNGVDELLQKERDYVAGGYEGLMARSPSGPYKFGRSTAREGTLLKMKRFHDAEAVVVGYNERLSNQNEQTRDELGRAKRSSHKANMVPTNSLGSLVCVYDGVEFELGSGFDERARRVLWQDPDSLLGRQVKFKFQELGPNKAPRFPVFLSFREDGA